MNKNMIIFIDEETLTGDEEEEALDNGDETEKF